LKSLRFQGFIHAYKWHLTTVDAKHHPV